MVSKDFADRPKHILCLFDVDGTLSLARQVRSEHIVSMYYSEPRIVNLDCIARND